MFIGYYRFEESWGGDRKEEEKYKGYFNMRRRKGWNLVFFNYGEG